MCESGCIKEDKNSFKRPTKVPKSRLGFISEIFLSPQWRGSKTECHPSRPLRSLPPGNKQQLVTSIEPRVWASSNWAAEGHSALALWSGPVILWSFHSQHEQERKGGRVGEVKCNLQRGKKRTDNVMYQIG